MQAPKVRERDAEGFEVGGDWGGLASIPTEPRDLGSVASSSSGRNRVFGTF